MVKRNSWKRHYDRHLNHEFVSNEDVLSTVHPFVCPTPFVSAEIVYSTTKKMKSNKAAGTTGVACKTLITYNEVCMKVVTCVIESIIGDGKIRNK